MVELKLDPASSTGEPNEGQSDEAVEDRALTLAGQVTDDPFSQFLRSHQECKYAFANALFKAKEAGDALHLIQGKTSLKGKKLFDHVRGLAKEAGRPLTIKNRMFHIYMRLARGWDKLQITAGAGLSDLTLTKALELLKKPKEVKPSSSTTTSDHHEEEPSPLSRANQEGGQPGSDTAPLTGNDATSNAVGEQADHDKPAQSVALAPISNDPQEPSQHGNPASRQGVEDGQATADAKNALAHVVDQLEELCREISHIEKPSPIGELIERALQLIQQMRSKVAQMSGIE